MTGRKIGFLRRIFGRGDTDSESASPAESGTADSGQTDPELAGPFFIRYVPGGPVKMLSRSADFSDIRTLDGEIIKPLTYLEIPVAPDVDALEIQVLLDELHGPDRDILEALETKSRYEEWSGRMPEQVKSMLFEALDELVTRGLCRVLESVITTRSGDVLRVDTKEETDTTPLALLAACHQADERMIRQLLERGADPGATDGKGWSAFHYLALNNAHPALFELMAEAGADPNAQSRLDANTALMIAVNNACNDNVRALLNAGASAAIARNDRLTALHMAVSKGEIEIARLLLEADADVDQRGYGHGGTALHIAAGQGNLQMITLLLEHGGDPRIADDHEHSAVEIANGTGHFDAAEQMLDALERRAGFRP